MRADPAIPTIDIDPLFGPACPAREAVDTAILKAAADSGFLLIAGLPEAELLSPGHRARLLAIFGLPPAAKARLLRRAFDANRPNVYRGWFPLQPGEISYKEGIDIGPDVLDPARAPGGADPLCEPTPLPDEAELPGWRAAAAATYRAMERIGDALTRALARGLGVPEEELAGLFQGGISSLRLARYPGRDAASLGTRDPATLKVEVEGRTHWLVNVPHADSGCVTLLAQNGVPGLQARLPDGRWVTVPPSEGTLAVNFGKLLERWTAGRIRATQHRVVALAGERCSIPFFYEPRVDAEIRPLPLPGAEPFEPFLYGDHLWAATTQFVEQRAIAHLRPPRGLGFPFHNP
jgi:isopenicillin N synthase-like dioxygenase